MAHGAARQRHNPAWPDEIVEQLRAALARHVPADAREEQSLRRVLEELDRLPRPFDEHAAPVHVTGSAVVAGRRGTVLHLHKRLHAWLQPGGHVDPGEGPPDAARRESMEETGLELRHPSTGPRLLHVDVHDAANGHVHLDIRYLLLADDSDPCPPLGESPDARWFSWEKAAALADVALAGALVAARRQPEVVALGEEDA